MGYSVVAEFVVQSETADAILKGLKTVKSWMDQANLEWQPAYFMTDFDEREISAVEELFPGLSTWSYSQSTVRVTVPVLCTGTKNT